MQHSEDKNLYALMQSGRVQRLIPNNTPFTVNDIQYPANWIEHASIDELRSLGVYPVIYGERPNENFYRVQEAQPMFDGTTVTISFIRTDLPLDDLQSRETAAIDAMAYGLLHPSDWIVTRAAECPDKPIPPAIRAFRASVRGEAGRLKAEIAEATSVSNLIAVIENARWPSPP